MALEELVNRIEAGKILKVDPRTVPRYADNGFLETIRDGHKVLYRRDDIELLKTKIDSRKELDPDIKEIYALKQCGLMDWQIMAEFEIDDVFKIYLALELYKGERKRYLNKFGIDGGEHEYLLLVEEAAARLKITDKHVIYDLINQGGLKAKKVKFKGKERYFINLQSVVDFLGKYSDKLLFRSDYAAESLDTTVHKVDRIACKKGIGFKIKTSKQGNYLFSSADILQMSISKH